jgi:CelD/BcsL family acetyltransferase involved in cellulose biosynthesis
LEFECYTTFPDRIEAEWNALLDKSVHHVPFLRHEYLRIWWQRRGGGEWPAEAELAVVTARQDGQLVGIAPLFKTSDPQGQTRLLLLGSIEISDYLDLIVAPDDLDAFVTELLPFLAGPQLGDWQVLDLYNLVDSSPTLAALERAATGLSWGFQTEKLQHSPYIPLPGDWETYLSKIDKKQRHEIRRKMRRAEESGAAIRWYFVSDPAEFEPAMQAFVGLMQQDEDKAAFFRRSPDMLPTMLETARCAFERGCLGLAFLEINGQKAAGYFCFDYLNRIWVYNSGIDRSLMEYSPGWVLLGYLLQWANETKRSEFDFMRGDEEYKYRFGAVDRFVLRATVTRK